MEIRLGGTDLVRADGRTDGRDKADSCFSRFCELA